ncbi:increased loss of mitochondrial DNA protein 1 [Schizothecium vesticola]|uniref:Increased loss of mitochondrial DNA protein 1 n=1 Tax=Schizothecium vesticola TaxID=314040 RepID=A0AA40F2T1_9PEZI|nr:increased loss of mitochondrial DNA protein 1 [Schizothecium vesticola]
MALISAKTIITSICLFHITLGFFFLTNPITIADQGIVYLLGEAMGLPYARSFEAQSPAVAFLGIMLASIGLCDLLTHSLPDDFSDHYWAMQAPLRLTIFFLLALYTFLFSPSSPLYTPVWTSGAGLTSGRLQHPSAHAHPPAGYAASAWGGEGLKNRVFFTFAFVETFSWFWVWVTLSEERGVRAARKARRRSGYGVQ